jgi:hypothetical protein
MGPDGGGGVGAERPGSGVGVGIGVSLVSNGRWIGLPVFGVGLTEGASPLPQPLTTVSTPAPTTRASIRSIRCLIDVTLQKPRRCSRRFEMPLLTGLDSVSREDVTEALQMRDYLLGKPLPRVCMRNERFQGDGFYTVSQRLAEK